uniref:PDZ domain-containing protein n=1 Tax=Corethron hystrix TaxID=216773 RepID=A0A7S1BHD7_9STRA|mmetsp:Transcript_25636/g.59149  ORF Transcript_25636/g.59149 Transcript_25636/m.59149 type:complete len:319 (+) Transcript_25636:65-1021(+)
MFRQQYAWLPLCFHLATSFISHARFPRASLPTALFEQSTAVDPDVYNVDIAKAAELWTVSVSADPSADRAAGVPYLDSKSKDYFVDDVALTVSRAGGMGMELLELAGGREDGLGLVIVEAVGGNAAAAGVIPGDAIAGVEVRTTSGRGVEVVEEMASYGCECRDFDATMGVLTSLPSEAEEVVLRVKRIRRWPKVEVVVEYPPVQCAEGADNTEKIELFAGENLRRGLLNRGIVMEDRDAKICDFCGGKCTVKLDMGMALTNPMGSTETKLMKYNPKCRLSCKTVVGHNMQEGIIRLKVNLNEWKPDDVKATNPFFSR